MIWWVKLWFFFSFNSWVFFNPIVFTFLSWLLCRITRNKPCRRICLTKATPKCSRALGSRTVEGTTLYFISMNVALVHFCVCALMSELVLLKNGPLTYLASRTCRHLRMILLVWTSPYNLPNHCFNIFVTLNKIWNQDHFKCKLVSVSLETMCISDGAKALGTLWQVFWSETTASQIPAAGSS